MAAENRSSSPGNSGPNLGSLIDSVIDSYRQMDMPVPRYLGAIILPSVVFFLFAFVAAISLDIPIMVRLPIPLLGMLILGAAVMWPKIQMDQRRKSMEDRFHIYITHMTVLATTNIDRVEVFRRVAAEEEYGALAEETRRVVQLVDTWNQSLDDACRMRAKKVPSKVVSDFFERLAYTINSGEGLDVYLTGEQNVMIRNYATVYESALDNLEVMKDLYLSMVLSVTFALVFATVLPILSGTNPTMTVSAVVVMYSFVQAGFLFAIYSIAPNDPLWYFPEEHTTRTERKLQLGMGVGYALCVALVVGVIMVILGMTSIDPQNVPLPLYAAVPTTPLIIPGLVARGEEARVKERDEEFTSFIRALGSSETARQTTTTAVLESLRSKDFGALTANVDDLFKRLNLRVDAKASWRFFTADAHSYLIQKFSEMYLIGRQMGGDPKHLGELISANMNEVNQLRESREQATMTLIGVLYGITAAATFAFFIGLGIVEILSGMTLGLNAGSSFDFSSLIHTGVYDIQVIEYLLVITVLVNSLLSSLIIRVVDGGHKVNSYMHFVVLTWISSIIGIMTLELVGGLLSI